MKDKDFQVGDKVTDIRIGRGLIEEIDGDSTYPIVAFFGYKNKMPIRPSYTLCGRYEETDNHPSLFHGHNVKVIGEENPVRKVKRYVNLYDNHIWTSWETAEEARKAAGYRIIVDLVATAIEIEMEDS